MTSNLTRFEKDLEKLIKKGNFLEYSMMKEIDEKEFLKQAKEQLKADDIDAFLKNLLFSM